MSRITWNVTACELTTDHESELCTITLTHGPYTAYVSMRPRDGVPRYDVIKARVRRPPAIVWPREAGMGAPDPRTPLYKAVTELRHTYAAQVCSLVGHAWMGSHSPYCEDKCSVPVHVPPPPVGVLR